MAGHSSESLRTQLSPVLAEDGWVIDGAYTHKLGDLVVRAADQNVWLDLPIRIWLPRLIRRTAVVCSPARSFGTAIVNR